MMRSIMRIIMRFEYKSGIEPGPTRGAGVMVIMRRPLTRTVFCLAALVILTSCAGKVKSPNYYTLNLPAPPEPPAAENAHARLEVRDFRETNYLRLGDIFS